MKDTCNAHVCIKGGRMVTTSYMSDLYNQHLALAYLEAYLEPSPTSTTYFSFFAKIVNGLYMPKYASIHIYAKNQ